MKDMSYIRVKKCRIEDSTKITSSVQVFRLRFWFFFLKNAVQMIQIEIESAENASADSKTEKQHQRHFSWYSLETAGSGPDLLTL